MRRLSALALAALAALAPRPAQAARLKDLAAVAGARDNELFGYGLVVGLAGTGDTEQAPFTQQSLGSMLGRLGLRVPVADLRVRNVAAVMVTARLPAFARAGTRLDAAVGSIGTARSLEGGFLLLTPLTGADGTVRAAAQGPVQTGGLAAGGAAGQFRRNQPAAGRIPGGAIVERPVIPSLSAPVVLQLREPDFTTARRVAAAVDAALGDGSAHALDAAAVEVRAGGSTDPVELLARLEAVEVEADRRARVVVSERTGVVVAGENVRLRPATVAHGELRVTVGEAPVASQPGTLARAGNTAVLERTQVDVTETSRGAVAMPAAGSVDELARALNALGAGPRDLVSILQALKAAGALDAELEVL